MSSPGPHATGCESLDESGSSRLRGCVKRCFQPAPDGILFVLLITPEIAPEAFAHSLSSQRACEMGIFRTRHLADDERQPHWQTRCRWEKPLRHPS